MGLTQIVVKLIPLSVTTILVVFGFAHMFFFSSISRGECADYTSSDTITEDNWFCDVSASYCISLMMLLEGEHQFPMGSPVRLTEPKPKNAILVLFALLIGILLLNILIALISNMFSKVSEKGTEEFWSNIYASMFELRLI